MMILILADCYQNRQMQSECYFLYMYTLRGTVFSFRIIEYYEPVFAFEQFGGVSVIVLSRQSSAVNDDCKEVNDFFHCFR